MDKKNVPSILQDALEDQIPASEIKLWKAVKTRLVAVPYQQGEKMKAIEPRRVLHAAYAGLIIVVLLVLALVTPQGRAFAQNILQFFARADKDRYPLQTWQMTPPA